jgi:catechol 2,3-dioxygenase-like lactoylglutathione lyase family enzyme
VIRKFAHIGMSVSNLERSIRFYQMLLDMKVLVEGPFEGPDYSAILGLDGARGRVALLRAETVQIELFEFTVPQPKTQDAVRPVCDHGITHLAFEVRNLQTEYDRLVALGVSFHCPPVEFFGSIKATYGRDPDGNTFELIEAQELSSAGSGRA